MNMKIYKTKNYDKFTLLFGNRNIDPANLKRMIRSMNKVDLPVPIIVKRDKNGNLVIIDGQHRLAAAKELGKPIFYIIIDNDIGLSEVRTVNQAQKGWELYQYLTSFIAEEIMAKNTKGPYHIFQWFKNKYDLPYTVCFDLLAKKPMYTRSTTRAFKDGKFTVKNLTQAIREADFITSLKNYTDLYKVRKFVMALVIAMRDARFDVDRFINQLKKPSCKQMMGERPTTDLYMDLINEINNYRIRDEDKVFFHIYKKTNGAYIK
jgi:hypothetical protein